MNKEYEIAVIGGGASGLIAAVSAAQHGPKVVVLEASGRIGTKILATGNGRCNLSNECITPKAYNVPAFVEPVLSHYDSKRICLFFDQIGLLTRADSEGRIWPISNAASSVLDVLRIACKRFAVEIICNFEADIILKQGEEFIIGAAKQTAINLHDATSVPRSIVAKNVIVACGGGSELLKSCGHTVRKSRKVLCALKTDTSPIRGLSGVRAYACARLFDSARATEPYAAETGEILFRDYGLSGIAVFNLSRFAQIGDFISVDFLPDYTKDEVRKMLQTRIKTFTRSAAYASGENDNDECVPTYAQLLSGMFHSRVVACVLRAAHCKQDEVAQRKKCTDIAFCIKDIRMYIKGSANIANAQVTRGGAIVDEFEPATLESRKVPGLFAAGEVLDVDGKCGGFNLHWAWASGIVAARAAVAR